MDRRNWPAFAALAALVAFAGCSHSADAEKEAAPGAAAEVKRFPSFVLKDTSGRDVSSDQFRGKTLLVNYWATWCEPCKKEMPGFEQLSRRYAANGLVVVGVAMDTDAKAVAVFGKKLGVTYPLLMGSPEFQGEVGLLGLPTTWVVDRDGVIRKTVIGFAYTEEIEAALKPIL